MAYDPETYLTATAPADFAPLTDAVLVLGLMRADVGRSAKRRSLATYAEEAIAAVLAQPDDGSDASAGLLASAERFAAREAT